MKSSGGGGRIPGGQSQLGPAVHEVPPELQRLAGVPLAVGQSCGGRQEVSSKS